jgi:TatD DNase family protein
VPPSPPPLIDTHCHLAFSAFDEDRSEVLNRAREAGLVSCVAVAVDAQSARQALALAKAEPGFVYATAGIHPTEEAVADPAEFPLVRELLESKQFVAVGETGLDAYHECAPLDIQRDALIQHLNLALQCDLPVVLHCRDAFPELLAALESYRGEGLRGVLHCFTGGHSEREALLSLGLHIGVGGIATYKPNSDLREVVREIPDERLLIETDAPWLSPVPMRGRRNEPAFVAHVASRLSEERQQPLATLAKQCTANAQALFRF